MIGVSECDPLGSTSRHEGAG
jgi:hypothetical protein